MQKELLVSSLITSRYLIDLDLSAKISSTASQCFTKFGFCRCYASKDSLPAASMQSASYFLLKCYRYISFTKLCKLLSLTFSFYRTNVGNVILIFLSIQFKLFPAQENHVFPLILKSFLDCSNLLEKKLNCPLYYNCIHLLRVQWTNGNLRWMIITARSRVSIEFYLKSIQIIHATGSKLFCLLFILFFFILFNCFIFSNHAFATGIWLEVSNPHIRYYILAPVQEMSDLQGLIQMDIWLSCQNFLGML